MSTKSVDMAKDINNLTLDKEFPLYQSEEKSNNAKRREPIWVAAEATRLPKGTVDEDAKSENSLVIACEYSKSSTAPTGGREIVVKNLRMLE